MQVNIWYCPWDGHKYLEGELCCPRCGSDRFIRSVRLSLFISLNFDICYEIKTYL